MLRDASLAVLASNAAPSNLGKSLTTSLSKPPVPSDLVANRYVFLSWNFVIDQCRPCLLRTVSLGALGKSLVLET